MNALHREPPATEREARLPACLFPELYAFACPGLDADPLPDIAALGPAVAHTLWGEGFDLRAPVVVSASQEAGTFSVFQVND